MTQKDHNHGSGASKRLEALSDGIFAIAATILVLEIRVPEIEVDSSSHMIHALIDVLPSFVAFVLSFLNILIFWVNHDSIGKVITRFDSKLTYMNIIFLLFISLVPFTTAFVSRYPYNIVAISCYGLLFFFTSNIAALMYYYLAFKSDLMDHKISKKSRTKIWKRVSLGPIFFAVAIMLGWINVYISIVIYLLVPLMFVVFPKVEFEE